MIYNWRASDACERAMRASETLSGLFNRESYIIGERAKRARHSLVCSIENRGYIIIIIIYIVRAIFVLITR